MDNVLNEVYEEWFFRDNIADSLPMAKYLAPKIKEYLNITSVFDVGCAAGHWLSCFEKEGCEISGLEGTTNATPYMMVDIDKIDIHDLVEGDGTGLNAGEVRIAANWETHEDAMEGNFDKLSFKKWDNIWIPFWFPQNMIALRKK